MSTSQTAVMFCGWKDNNNNNIHICIAPYGRNFRGAKPHAWRKVMAAYRRTDDLSCYSKMLFIFTSKTGYKQ